MTFKNIRRDEDCAMTETKLAGEFLERTIDHYDDIPEDMRVIVIVASGDGKGKIGCAYEGYDSDERLALDLQMLSQAVDLGPAPTADLQRRLDSTVDAHVEATSLHNDERDRWRTDLDGARAALRREQDSRAQLRVELDRTKAERDEAQMLCRDARIQAMDRGASYQTAVAERDDLRAGVVKIAKVVGIEPLTDGHARVLSEVTEHVERTFESHRRLAIGAAMARKAEMLACGEIAAVPEVGEAFPPAPCCPQSTLPGSPHDVGCRGGGKVH